MIKRNIKFCLYSFLLTNCSGHTQISHQEYYRNQVRGKIIRPILSLESRHVFRPRDISSIVETNEERSASLTLVVMDRECGDEYYTWLQSNTHRIVSSDMKYGAIIHKISHRNSNEFVVIVDEDQMPMWRIDVGALIWRRSKVILFGPRSYRFKRVLSSILSERKVIVPNEGCNINYETIIGQAIDS